MSYSWLFSLHFLLACIVPDWHERKVNVLLGLCQDIQGSITTEEAMGIKGQQSSAGLSILPASRSFNTERGSQGMLWFPMIYASRIFSGRRNQSMAGEGRVTCPKQSWAFPRSRNSKNTIGSTGCSLIFLKGVLADFCCFTNSNGSYVCPLKDTTT